MADKYLISLDLPSYMTDCHKRLRPVYFMCLAQELALKGADVLGFGYDITLSRGVSWVLSRMHVKYLDTPRWRDEISMRTWHKGLNGLYFIRDFEMLDSGGRPVALATSSWVLMNVTERRVTRPDRLSDIVPSQPQCEESAIEENAPKLQIPKDAEAVRLRSHRVHFSDIDFIGHTNNTKYIEWALDCVPEELLLNRQVKDFYVNYIQESKLDDVIDLYLCTPPPAEDGRHNIIEGRLGDRPIFICDFVF